MESFSFSPSKALFEKRERLLAVTSFGTTDSVFIITHIFSVGTPGYWRTLNYSRDAFFDKLKEL